MLKCKDMSLSVGSFVLLFFLFSLSHAQAVTLSVSDGLGIRGSICCNPNYPESNRVELGLDNPSDKVGVLQVDICTPHLGGNLVLSGWEVTPRAENLNHTITQVSGCIQVRFSWTQSGSVYIAEGSGPIVIFYFDVSQFAVSGTCTDLTMSAITVLNQSLQPLSVTPVEGEFCYYNCSADQHCDDGVFCNGQEQCFNNAWCIDSFSGDPCYPLLCNEGNNKCYCDANEQCDDFLWCNGAETCTVATGKCKNGSNRCVSDGDPCTLDCSESTQTCTYACTAEGPWDYCCEYSANCASEAVCNEEATLQVGNGTGAPGSEDREVVVSLSNPNNTVKGVLVDICDVNDYLTVNAVCTKSTRVPNGYGCACNENPTNGCASCSLYDQGGTLPPIPKGSGPLFTMKYDVAGYPTTPYGQCQNLAVDITGNGPLVLSKECAGSSNPGTPCIFNADCPGGTCVLRSLVTMPDDGEFCFPCSISDACNVGNPCINYSCVSGLCVYTNKSPAPSCSDGNSCTNDACKKADAAHTGVPMCGGQKCNVCVGTDKCPDDEDYCSGVEYCSAGACYDTGDPCDALTCNDDVCLGSDVTLSIADGYGREGVINIALENSNDRVSEVHLNVCDRDLRGWLHISTESCNTTSRSGGFDCSISDEGGGCVGIDVTSQFPLDAIETGEGPITQLTYTIDPVTIPMSNYADLEPQSIEIRDEGDLALTVTSLPGKVYAIEYCEGDFEPVGGDGDVDSYDATSFVVDFGRNIYHRPCTTLDPCNGDFDCDVDVDAGDVSVFIVDFGRNIYNNMCPPASSQFECAY